MVKNNLNYKQYVIKKKLYESLLKDEKFYKKELLKEEKKLQKQKLQNKKYQNLDEYNWLRNNKRLYEEQIQLENSISSKIAYYKNRLEKLPEEISYEKSEMKRLKKIITKDNPSFDFKTLKQPEKRNYKKELEFRLEKLKTYIDILEENFEKLEKLRQNLDKIQTIKRKSKIDKDKEREYIESISNIRSSTDHINRAMTGCKIFIADMVMDEYLAVKNKK